MKSKAEFLELTAEYNMIPIYDEFIADIETPISLYKKLALNKDYTYLLESSENDRYSFIGLKPAAVFTSIDEGRACRPASFSTVTFFFLIRRFSS